MDYDSYPIFEIYIITANVHKRKKVAWYEGKKYLPQPHI